MTDPREIWLVIAGMAATNFLLRSTPLTLISKIRLPEPVHRWLGYVPVSVMASLVATETVRPGGTWILTFKNPYLLAAAPTALVFVKTRSFLGATLVGMASFLAFRALLG